jgi:hypothetical protein
MISCPKCNTPFNPNGKWGLKKFCSRSCANSKSFSDESKLKKSNSALANLKSGKTSMPDNKGKQLVERVEWRCTGCGIRKLVLPSFDKKHCSKACGIENGTLGGAREKSGRAKSGYYKGIYCGSTYELCWVIYSLDHNVKFERFPGYLKSGSLKYYPDFLLDDKKTIVEIKGYENEKVALKTALAESLGYRVKLLKKEDLFDIFQYIKEQYSTTKFYDLYDGYSPKYSYKCCCCDLNFTADNKRRGDRVFCSRSCSMTANHKSKVSPATPRKNRTNQHAKFDKEQVLTIFHSSLSLSKLATEFNCTKAAIWCIKQKRTYKWIHD